MNEIIFRCSVAADYCHRCINKKSFIDVDFYYEISMISKTNFEVASRRFPSNRYRSGKSVKYFWDIAISSLHIITFLIFFKTTELYYALYANVRNYFLTLPRQLNELSR